MHVTAVTPRYFQPNLKTKRVWVPELKKFVTVKATARAFKTLSKNGAYKTLAAAAPHAPASRLTASACAWKRVGA